MPRRTKFPFATVAILGAAAAIGATVCVVVNLSNSFLNSSAGRSVTSSRDGCPSNHRPEHRVIIQNSRVTPGQVVATKCDLLTITNLDQQSRLMAFGLHANHVPYDGVSERVLTRGESFTVTLVQAGEYSFHDHDQGEVEGTFTVSP